MAGDKSERLKMYLNVPTGKLRAAAATPDDRERGLTMCLIGQILITILREMFEENGYKIVQINTDGIMVQNHGTLMPKIETITKEWSARFAIPIQYKWIKHLEQLDVNNYQAFYEDGSVKVKGAKFKQRESSNKIA